MSAGIGCTKNLNLQFALLYEFARLSRDGHGAWRGITLGLRCGQRVTIMTWRSAATRPRRGVLMNAMTRCRR